MRKSWLIAFALSASIGTAIAIAQQTRSAPAIDLPTILAIEADRAAAASDLDALLAATRGKSATYAVRALGRLERRDLIGAILPLLGGESTRGAAATAAVVALKGRPLDGVTPGQQEREVLDALIAAGDLELGRREPSAIDEVSRALGKIPYQDADSFKDAEAFLRRVLEKPFPLLNDGPHAYAARGLEALQRLNRKLGSLADETVERLESKARTTDPKRSMQQRNAIAALVAAQRVDDDTLKVALKAIDEEVRRYGALALAGSGSPIADEPRVLYIRELLSDTSPMVRLEALRAWTRRGVAAHGCQPLLDALRDRSLHVVLAAIDALGDVCRDDESITVIVTSEARTPPPQGSWHREAHAFVALAKRDRERANIGLLTFATHTTWQVRMYAARAAAILQDADVLARLAADPDDNVAETALPPLRRLKGSESDTAFIAALNRRTRAALKATDAPARPYQVIRAAAIALEKATPTRPLADALAGALERISAERCETSRDARLAIIDRLAELGSPANAGALQPLLMDIDPRVGEAAAQLLTQWTGRAVQFDTPRTRSANIPTEKETDSRVRVSIEMENGGRIEIMPLSSTPLTRQRFLAAARAGYYDRLTFHRVVPNFVIQGGSPNANEYCGDCAFMRDEPGEMQRRGTVGISTRGRDTGDAQIYINLVDNARLDYDYTAFAAVCSGMDVADAIREGDRIVRVQELPPTPTCGG